MSEVGSGHVTCQDLQGKTKSRPVFSLHLGLCKMHTHSKERHKEEI